MRKKIAAANWKMNLSYNEGETLLDQILGKMNDLKGHQQAIFAVPFPYLKMAADKGSDINNVFIAAQNCYSKKSGAFTGEVSVEMLTSINIRHVIIGHSERREYFHEDNALLAEKVNLCIASGLTPVFCCGESLSIRENNEQNGFVETQLKESLFQLNAEDIKKVIIAYEPIWAIGTGKTASTAQAQEMHAHLRQVLAAKYGEGVAEEISILYGGSVKAANATELFNSKDVDGGLVGGASLQAEEFLAIINALP